jgi:hypothetical protein
MVVVMAVIVVMVMFHAIFIHVKGDRLQNIVHLRLPVSQSAVSLFAEGRLMALSKTGRSMDIGFCRRRHSRRTSVSH